LAGKLIEMFRGASLHVAERSIHALEFLAGADSEVSVDVEADVRAEADQFKQIRTIQHGGLDPCDGVRSCGMIAAGKER